MVGVDGARLDTVRSVATPALDALAGRGFLAPVRVEETAPTISGPSWATILTGVLPSVHKITDNQLSPNALAAHPDVVTTARRLRPRLATFVAANWAPLVRSVSGGPLLAGGGWCPDGEPARSPAGWQRSDRRVATETVRFLTGHDGTAGALVFCYLGGVDEVAHLVGTGAEYAAAIEAADARLAELLAALADRPGHERWTVLVVTDHGHRDGGGHGGDTDAERTAWLAAAGPGIPATPPPALAQADVAAHVLHVLGLPPGEEPASVGRPLDR